MKKDSSRQLLQLKTYEESKIMLTENDIQQIEKNNLCQKTIERQLQTFKNGIPFANVVAAASITNGILKISASEKNQLIDFFDQQSANIEVVKFVPASGAASRMFKFLHHFLDCFNPEKDKLEEFILVEENSQIRTFYDSYKKFAFYEEVRKKLIQKDADFNSLSEDRQFYSFVNLMMTESGINYGNLPKGLIPFHKYKNHVATAFEEQLLEAFEYSKNNTFAKVHFTVSEAHLPKFKEAFYSFSDRLQQQTNSQFQITYSFQKKETNTIAVTMDNEVFRNEHGEILFRPAGHGALIENLNELEADVIFIKNIDNVIYQTSLEENTQYKKMLGGKLLEVQARIFSYLKLMENHQHITDAILMEIKKFCETTLNQNKADLSTENLINSLNRPLRICGVVPNTGAPGGGPFWVKDENGTISLQIVEMSQIDLDNENQKLIVNSATHFNPVDLVCATRNYKGEKFDLMKYINPNAGFISIKSENGKQLKALELPGLWNGAMANWNTIFVEVPIETFNPVKTVNDLLQPNHQPIN